MTREVEELYLTIVAYGCAEAEGFHTVPAEQPHLTKQHFTKFA